MPLNADRFHFSSGAGDLACYVAGQGPPLLLVHSMNAAGSAAEMRPLLDAFRATRTVFANDLPGFGHSDRSDRAYDARLMTDAIQATAQQVHGRCGTGPIDALALSTGAEFLARAASEKPAVTEVAAPPAESLPHVVHAQECLAEIEKKDPKTVTEAKRFFLLK